MIDGWWYSGLKTKKLNLSFCTKQQEMGLNKKIWVREYLIKEQFYAFAKQTTIKLLVDIIQYHGLVVAIREMIKLSYTQWTKELSIHQEETNNHFHYTILMPI
jgi:hypothetical protein